MPESFKTFRDPLLSLYQSAVTEVGIKIDNHSRGSGRLVRGIQPSAKNALEDAAASIAEREFYLAQGGARPSSTTETSRDLTKLGIARVCAELALRYIKAMAASDEQSLAQLRDEFTAGTCDPAWVTTLEEYRRFFGPDGKRKSIPYIRPAEVGPATIEIKPDARLAIVGDWGTGAAPAVEVLKLIDTEQPHAVIHLGDIYYSGTSAECETHFLDLVNGVLRKTKPVPVFTLTGNHDMYSGGEGFYDLIKKLNPPPYEQRASFFCLRSSDERWQLLGLDTGLHDDNPTAVAEALTYLEDDELEWHQKRIQEFAGRTILLSHHQLFSAFSPIGTPDKQGKRSAANPKLLEAFQRMRGSKEIAAWLWGHEHSLGIYKPFSGLERGRCVGHGAVPVSVLDKIYDPLPELVDAPTLIGNTQLTSRGGVYNHGYAMLAFNSDRCNAKYFEATGSGRRLIFEEEF